MATLISRLSGTVIGNQGTQSGAAANLFDGNTSQTGVTGSEANAANAYCGKDWQSGNSFRIDHAVVYPTTNDGYNGNITIGTNVTFDLYASNSSPSNATNGTLLGSTTLANSLSGSCSISSNDTSTLYRYVWVYWSSGGIRPCASEIEFWQANQTLTLTAAVGDYALTGIAAALLKGKTLTAATGSYILTGIAALQKISRSSAVGSYTLTGVAAILRHGYTLVSSVGSYALTGITAFQKISRASAVGNYALTGSATGFVKALHMAAAKGTYVYTGIAATLRKNISLIANHGTYVLTGFAVYLVRIVASERKRKNRVANFVLQKLRVNPPTLSD